MLTQRFRNKKNRSNIFIQLAFICFLASFLSACKQEAVSPQEVLDQHFAYVFPQGRTPLENISTLANCLGPDGAYLTITESLGKEDYLYFHQNFFYQDNFSAIVLNSERGFTLSDSLQVLDTLPPMAIPVLKSHEFHKIALQLDTWFFDFTRAADTAYFSIPSIQLLAKDQWEQPHRLFFDLNSGQCIGFQLQNPMNPEEKIRIHYKEWTDQNGITLFNKADIIQGSDQRFTFDFDRIELNKPNFKTLKQ